MREVIRASIRKPVATLVWGIVLVLFGALAMFRMPIQLTPTLEAPRITVTTAWPGATPAEIERDIIVRQEEQLEDLEQLVRMESSSFDGLAAITLTFPVGTDLDFALMRAATRLQQVRGMPLDADEPVIETTGSDHDRVAWFMLTPNGDSAETALGLSRLGPLMHDIARPRFERVEGVSQVQVFGARALEMQVRVDSRKLAARGITLAQLADALGRDNRDWGAGDYSDGKRRWKVRSLGAYHSPEELEEAVIGLRQGVPVRLGDVADVELSQGELGQAGFYLDEPTIGVSIAKKPGTNVLQVMEGLRVAVDELNRGPLAEVGVRLEQSYDETEYIDRAIVLVRQSLLIGGVLAVCMLLIFLRSAATTFLVSVAIPVSLIATFSILWLTGRTLNVVTLAGLAFAVGMVVDNSIVVIENIYRHRQMGKSRRRSAMEGTSEVWGAVVASTLTTVAVFLPIAFIQGEVGQLFRDLAVAISSSVLFSMLVALTLIPSLSSKLLEVPTQNHRQPGRGPMLGKRIADGISHTVYRLCGSMWVRLAVVLGVTVSAVLLTWGLTPPLEYLPKGNRNFVYGVVVVPGDYNIEQTVALREPFVERLRPLWTAEEAKARSMAGGGLRSFYYVAFPGGAIFGLRARDPDRAAELVDEVAAIGKVLPGARAFASQRSIFDNSIARGRNIDIALTGPDLPRLMELARQVMAKAEAALPEAQIRPSTQLEIGSPEIRVSPDRFRLAQLGIQSRDIGLATSAAVDGAWVGRYIHEGRELDLKLIDAGLIGHEGVPPLEEVPVPTPSGDLVTLGSLAEVIPAKAPSEIHRLDRQRTVQIFVEPPPETALAEAMALIQEEVVEPMRESGALGETYAARLSGSSDSLTEMVGSMSWIFALAVVLTFLLMAALFESFLYPFIIMWTVPLATLGGVIGLGALSLFQHQGLDVLTMLGFVILVGTVVNNAILLVHQALIHLRQDDMSARDAVTAAARNRVRPIFMSVTTSVFGMLPLVLFPGAGSELYRGLGSVVVGGLLVSTVLTLFVIPCLLSLVLDWRRGMLLRWRQSVGRRGEESSRFDLARPIVDKGSGTFAAADPSGTIDL